MKTSQLRGMLDIARSSLGASDNNLLPVLSHFCFVDDFLYAYNEVSAIVVEGDVGMTCALHGETLLGVLSVSTSEDIKIKMQDANIQIDVGSGWVKIPTLSKPDFVFAYPNDDNICTVPYTDSVADGMDRCLFGVGNDVLKPEYMGITFAMRKKKLVLYSTDQVTASRFVPEEVKLEGGDASFVLPEQTCDQILKLRARWGKGDPNRIAFAARNALVEFDERGTTLISKLIEAKPETFDDLFISHTGGVEFCAIPEGLEREMRKASVLIGKDTIKECVLSFDAGFLTIMASGSRGSMKSKIPVESKKLSGMVCIKPEHILRVIGAVDKFAVNDQEKKQSLVLTGGPFTHVISSMPIPERMKRVVEKGGTGKVKPPDKLGGLQDMDDDIPF